MVRHDRRHEYRAREQRRRRGGGQAYSGRGFEASGGRDMAEGGFADIGGGADVAAR